MAAKKKARLRHCPFCDSNSAALVKAEGPYGWLVRCGFCLAHGSVCAEPERAVMWWNKRIGR